jgi:hypothetical protein
LIQKEDAVPASEDRAQTISLSENVLELQSKAGLVSSSDFSQYILEKSYRSNFKIYTVDSLGSQAIT